MLFIKKMRSFFIVLFVILLWQPQTICAAEKQTIDANSIHALSAVLLDGDSGRVLYEELKKKGVLVRFWGKEKIEDFLRITIGTPEQMEVLFAKTAEILQEQKGD